MTGRFSNSSFANNIIDDYSQTESKAASVRDNMTSGFKQNHTIEVDEEEINVDLQKA